MPYAQETPAPSVYSSQTDLARLALCALYDCPTQAKLFSSVDTMLEQASQTESPLARFFSSHLLTVCCPLQRLCVSRSLRERLKAGVKARIRHFEKLLYLLMYIKPLMYAPISGIKIYVSLLISPRIKKMYHKTIIIFIIAKSVKSFKNSPKKKKKKNTFLKQLLACQFCGQSLVRNRQQHRFHKNVPVNSAAKFLLGIGYVTFNLASNFKAVM